MAQGATLRVEGYRELMRAIARANRETKTFVRSELYRAADPVRSQAAALAASEIPGMRTSPDWAGMRVGATQRVIYVAPKRRNRGGRKRPNLAGLLMTRAMLPALYRNEAQTVRRVEQALDRMARDWEQP